MRLTLIVLVFLIYNCCKEKQNLFLPPATQVGGDIFGCYANDDLIVFTKDNTGNFLNKSKLEAEYNVNKNTLVIMMTVSPNYYMYLTDDAVKMNYPHKLHSAEYSNGDSYFKLNPSHGSRISITKLDTINKIVSGTFSFKAQAHGSSKRKNTDPSVNISEGRFDISELKILYQ